MPSAKPRLNPNPALTYLHEKQRTNLQTVDFSKTN